MASLKEIIDNNELPVKVRCTDRTCGTHFTILHYDCGECRVRYAQGNEDTILIDGYEHLDDYEVVEE